MDVSSSGGAHVSDQERLEGKGGKGREKGGTSFVFWIFINCYHRRRTGDGRQGDGRRSHCFPEKVLLDGLDGYCTALKLYHPLDLPTTPLICLPAAAIKSEKKKYSSLV